MRQQRKHPVVEAMEDKNVRGEGLCIHDLLVIKERKEDRVGNQQDKRQSREEVAQNQVWLEQKPRKSNQRSKKKSDRDRKCRQARAERRLGGAEVGGETISSTMSS